MNSAQKMKEYIERELTNEAPKDSGLKVGDEVTWTNDYGVKFTNKIIGFNYTNEHNKEYNKFVHLDTDSYWFPHRVEDFKEDTSDYIYLENLEIELKNKKTLVFSYHSNMDNPIFTLKDSKQKFTILDDTILTVSGDEPDTPVSEEYQSEFLETHKYNFFKSRFESKA